MACCNEGAVDIAELNTGSFLSLMAKLFSLEQLAAAELILKPPAPARHRISSSSGRSRSSVVSVMLQLLLICSLVGSTGCTTTVRDNRKWKTHMRARLFTVPCHVRVAISE